MDDRQLQRIASNEARFRDLNDNMVRALDEIGELDSYEVICECAVLDCEDMVRIPRQMYARVRSEPRWFVVLPEHVLEAAEEPVTKNDTYWVIEKVNVAGKRAEDLYNAP